MTMYNGAEAPHAGTEHQKADPQSPPSPATEERHDDPSGLAQAQPDAAERIILAPPSAVDVSPAKDESSANISVIGADLAISGQDVHVISKGKIRVEGSIQGDVLGTEVVIGDVGKVEGVVSGDIVKVFGVIMGTIRGVQVEIEAGAKVEADVHHHTLSVDAGAQIEGRVCRTRDTAEVTASAETRDDHLAASSPQPQASTAPHQRRGRLWS